ncbi:MAG TPA: hypothetical protein VFO18_17790 [Methylomirabilota bacterium]|nr:hypothetical protein [Methylomirabilota bacterium]
MPVHGVMLTSVLALLLCFVWLIVFVATALAYRRGFKVSLNVPGVDRLDRGWFVAALLLLAGLVMLLQTYAVGELP